jgi:beta-mannanase
MIKIWLLLFFSFLISCNSQDNEKENLKAKWINDAFDAIESGNYPNIKAISWWHENWEGTSLRLDSSPQATETFQNRIENSLYETECQFENNKLKSFENGIYHNAFPDFGGQENFVSDEKIIAYQDLIGKDIAWAYFSNNWIGGIFFPLDDIAIIHNNGNTPFVRLMARSDFEEYGQDETYTMQRIINGDFDTELNEWFSKASQLNYPILCEFGTEMNGNWFPWNGQYAGAGITNGYGEPDYPDGPERFRDAYRHIIDIANTNNANNITWFFHIDDQSYPQEDWNAITYYYPGDDYIDWLGVSIYGPYSKEEDFIYFSDFLAHIYPELIALSPDKPIAVLEFGITEL